MALYKENHEVNEAINNTLNHRCAAELVAHSMWLFLVTTSDKIWGRTSKVTSVEVIL